MNKTYQPFIIAKANEIIDAIQNGHDVLGDLGVTSFDFIRGRLCDMLTEKFVKGEYNEELDIVDLFPTEDSMLLFLSEIATRANLDVLIEQGLVGMIEDENDEEFYFMTELGKIYTKDLLKRK
jgi:hypothetical protein